MRFERDFTQLPNQWLRDKRLSRAARGLLSELMTHEVGYELTLTGLVASGPEGRDAIRTMVHELERVGYLERVRERRRGRLGGMRWTLQDPFDTVDSSGASALPGLEKPRSTSVGKPYVGGTYAGPTASENPTTIEDQSKNRNNSLPSATTERPVDNSRGACGHEMVDDRHCYLGCPPVAVAS